MTIKFEEDYSEFEKWCQSHPGSYCVNSGRTKESAYALLHNTQCGHLIGYQNDNMPVGKQRIKICSDSYHDLFIWCLAERPKIKSGFHALCKTCITNHEQVWDSLGKSTPVSSDVDEPGLIPRVSMQISRIVRDTAISRYVKQLNGNICQLCGCSLHLSDGTLYSEAHHIQPLAKGGPDILENVICVCPNCHALLDFAAISLDLATLRLHQKHMLGEKYIDYHNEEHERKKVNSSSGI